MLPYKFAGIITAAGYIGDGAVGVITRPHSEESEEEEFNLFVVLEAKVPGHGRDIFIDSYPSRDVALARLRNL